MTTVTLRVLGIPAPQGSKRHVGHGILVESSKKVGPWREAVVAQARYEDVAGLHIDEPVTVQVTFWLPRPKGHMTTKGDIRPSAPTSPGVKPDLDKLLRSTLDALVQADIVADDSRVVSILAHKRYADREPPGALIFIHLY